MPPTLTRRFTTVKCLIPGPHQKTQQQSRPKILALRILREYMAGINVGWSCWSGWKKGIALQPAAPAAPADWNPSHVFPENTQGWYFWPAPLLGFLVWPWYQLLRCWNWRLTHWIPQINNIIITYLGRKLDFGAVLGEIFGDNRLRS